MTSDMVNNPPHYNKHGIECIKAIEAALTEEEFKGYIKGNVHWVSVKANRIMNNGTPEEVMKIALYYQKVKEENINE